MTRIPFYAQRQSFFTPTSQAQISENARSIRHSESESEPRKAEKTTRNGLLQSEQQGLKNETFDGEEKVTDKSEN